jgi:hypothetical protein
VRRMQDIGAVPRSLRLRPSAVRKTNVAFRYKIDAQPPRMVTVNPLSFSNTIEDS